MRVKKTNWDLSQATVAKIIGDGKAQITSILPNPKRGKAAARYALYRNGMTIESYIASCTKLNVPTRTARADIAWDLQHGFIKLTGGPDESDRTNTPDS